MKRFFTFISFLVATMVVCLVALAMIEVFRPSWQSGSLYDAEFYFLKTEGSVYKIIVDREGNHHLTQERFWTGEEEPYSETRH